MLKMYINCTATVLLLVNFWYFLLDFDVGLVIRMSPYTDSTAAKYYQPNPVSPTSSSS